MFKVIAVLLVILSIFTCSSYQQKCSMFQPDALQVGAECQSPFNTSVAIVKGCQAPLVCFKGTCQNMNTIYNKACTTDSECQDSLSVYVTQMRCINSKCGFRQAIGGTCAANKDCYNWNCNNATKTCSAAASGSPCNTNENCDSATLDLYCHSTHKNCTAQGSLNDMCTSSVQCKPGFACSGGMCKTITQIPLGGACDSTNVTQACAYPNICNVHSKTCTALGGNPAGQNCTVGTDCQLGLGCVNGVCSANAVCTSLGDSVCAGACGCANENNGTCSTAKFVNRGCQAESNALTWCRNTNCKAETQRNGANACLITSCKSQFDAAACCFGSYQNQGRLRMGLYSYTCGQTQQSGNPTNPPPTGSGRVSGTSSLFTINAAVLVIVASLVALF